MRMVDHGSHFVRERLFTDEATCNHVEDTTEGLGRDPKVLIV